MKSVELDQDALIADAWRLLRELMETGEGTLKSGKVITADDAVVGVIERVAKLRRPSESRMAVLDTFRVRETQQKAG